MGRALGWVTLTLVFLTLVACAPDPGTSKDPASSARHPQHPTPTEGTPSEAKPNGTVPPAQGGLLDHVKVGQRYTFHLDQSGNQMEMVWEVSEITDSEVKYQVSTLKDGTPLGQASPSSWPIPSPPPEDWVKRKPSTKSKVKVRRETITVAGRAWDCQMTESDGVKTWVPMHGDQTTFPPLLKQSKGAVVSLALTKIEGP